MGARVGVRGRGRGRGRVVARGRVGVRVGVRVWVWVWVGVRVRRLGLGSGSERSCRTARSAPKRSWLSRQFHAACETSRQAELTTRSLPVAHLVRVAVRVRGEGEG